MPLITDPTSQLVAIGALAAAALIVMQVRGGGSSAVAQAMVPVRVRETLANYRSSRRRRR